MFNMVCCKKKKHKLYELPCKTDCFFISSFSYAQSWLTLIFFSSYTVYRWNTSNPSKIDLTPCFSPSCSNAQVCFMDHMIPLQEGVTDRTKHVVRGEGGLKLSTGRQLLVQVLFKLKLLGIWIFESQYSSWHLMAISPHKVGYSMVFTLLLQKKKKEKKNWWYQICNR